MDARATYPVPSGLWPAVTPNSGISASFTSRRMSGREETEATMAAAERAMVENFMMMIGLMMLVKIVSFLCLCPGKEC